MKLSKGQGISCFAAVVLFGIFTVVSFLLPLEHNATFWLGYFFALFALIAVLLSFLFFFEKTVKEERALNLPMISTAWVYFVAQAGLSFKEMTLFPAGYTIAAGVNVGMALLFTVIILAIAAVSSKTGKKEQFVRAKVSYIKDMKSRVENIKSDDSDLMAMLKRLAEDIRFSDPMSHSQLAEEESRLKAKVEELSANIGEVELAKTLCGEITGLLKVRNDKCKSLKGVKEPLEDVNDKPSGNKFAIAGVGVTLVIFAVTLFAVFIIAPSKDYKAACGLMEAEQYAEATEAFEKLDGFKDSAGKIEEINTILLDKKYDAAIQLISEEKYDEATSAFKELGDYRDSVEKIEEINTILLDKEYDAATQLISEEKYDEATSAFEKLGDYRDSAAKIEEIKKILLDKEYDAALSLIGNGDIDGAIAAFTALGDYRDSADKIIEIENGQREEKYANAERAFDKGDYATALGFYNELGDYKESKARIEDIYNRLSDGNVIYFGSYNSTPIAWKIVKREDDKLLLLANESIKKLPLTESLSVTEYKDSNIINWLREDFLEEFEGGKLGQICDTNGMKAFLLDEESIQALIDDEVDIVAEEDWWITTSSETGFMFVTADGKINEDGDLGIREKGIRPAIWLKLK